MQTHKDHSLPHTFYLSNAHSDKRKYENKRNGEKLVNTNLLTENTLIHKRSPIYGIKLKYYIYDNTRLSKFGRTH